MVGVLAQCEERSVRWKFRFQDELRADQATLLEDIDSISAVVDQFVELGRDNLISPAAASDAF